LYIGLKKEFVTKSCL